MNTNFFSAEEVFVRLGENRQKGCLVVFNKNESAHVFVENGLVTCALADKKWGEAALAHALKLQEATYSWLPEAEPVITNLKFIIQEYALKHCIARDVQVGQTIALPKQATKALPKEEIVKRFGTAKKELNLDFVYYFTDNESPTLKHKLLKVSNIVGRDESCDLVLIDPQVSRKHCMMQVTERGILVKDLESTNGTYANRIPLTDGYISRGDQLSLGSYELTLHVERNRG